MQALQFWTKNAMFLFKTDSCSNPGICYICWIIFFSLTFVFQSYIKCKNVDYGSQREETFFDIQLNIKGKKSGEYKDIYRAWFALYKGHFFCYPRCYPHGFL